MNMLTSAGIMTGEHVAVPHVIEPAGAAAAPPPPGAPDTPPNVPPAPPNPVGVV